MRGSLHILFRHSLNLADHVLRIDGAAAEQLDAIRAIEAGPGLDALPPVLQDTALLRIANPECSLTDLAALSCPPVTKSCMGHRIRKLMELSRKI